jgi:phage FluMu protein Com
MNNLQKINCKNCGKLLLEAGGEVKKICPKCKTMNHFIVTSFGVIDADELNIK